MNKSNSANQRKNNIPPHSLEAEQGVLACALEFPESLKQFATKPLDFFHDLRHATLYQALKEMHRTGAVIDIVTVTERLQATKQLKAVGGAAYLNELLGKATSRENLPYYLGILHEKYSLRKLQEVCRNSDARITNGGSATDLREIIMGIESDLATVARMANPDKERKALRIWNAKELAEYVPPEDLELVGDNEIFRGYEGVCIFAGPGSSGKSLAVSSLALAGAIGGGTWMGRKVHRQFKTLILQAENGKRRLKNYIVKLKDNHPDVDIDEHVFFSEPPEGGLDFNSPTFRAAVREEVLRIKPGLVILDPWSHVGCEDASDAVKAMLTLIRSCFPVGDDCPCLMIVAHTVKPRADNVRKGRGLMYMVTGSINLCNTARCVYVMLPWSEDIEDQRVYFATPKLNDGENYSPTVWKRKFGTFFEHDDKTNPRDFGKSEEAGEKISEDNLRACFEKSTELQSGKLVQMLCKISGCGESTAWRAIGDSDQGYLRPLLARGKNRSFMLKEQTQLDGV